MKKLTLNKKTISNLNNEDLNNVIGGATIISCVGDACVSGRAACGDITWIDCPSIQCQTDPPVCGTSDNC